MKITDAPALITTAFAQNGLRNDIPANRDGLDTGRASFATGFPDETMKPITAGGVPPFGADFNGILYALTNAARFYGAGGHYQFNGSFAAAIGGYPMGATVQASDNMGHWLNVVEANSTGPESGLSTGWLPLADHNGTATVNVGGNTTLTPLQAAKANIRFTGSPAGNSTITFPAWTKRYSIINDCAGDQSLICTTGNGESISIKNDAKYEIGCDGKNLTVATVNASQVFAEPNKNVSSLEAPTVQQIINALGAAASHGFFDTGDVEKIPYGYIDAASTGCVAAVRDYAKSINDSIKNSLKPIATSGDLNDGTGVLDMKRGGTGRSDGDLQAGTVFAHTVKNNGGAVTLATEGGDTVSVENGNVLSMKNANKDEKFRVDDGNISFGGGWKDPNIFKEDGDIVIRASSGERLRIEKDGAVTIKDKNGVETCRIQNGLITLAGGSRPNLQRTPYSMMMFADSGDSVSVESGGTVIGKKANGDTIVKMQEGKLFLNGEDRPVLQRLDSGTFIDSKSGDYLSIEPGNALVVHNSSGETTLKIENGTLTVGTVPFDHVSGDVPFNRVSGDISLSRVSDAGAAAKWGVWDNNNPDEFIDGQTQLVSLGTIKGLRDRLQTAYGISTFATARKIDGGPVKYNDNIPGTHLVTSGSAGDDGSPTLLSGTWKCLGEAKNNSGISLYVRIS